MHAILIQIREVTAPPPDEEGVTEPVSVYLTEKGKGREREGMMLVRSGGIRELRHQVVTELLFS